MEGAERWPTSDRGSATTPGRPPPCTSGWGVGSEARRPRSRASRTPGGSAATSRSPRCTRYTRWTGLGRPSLPRGTPPRASAWVARQSAWLGAQAHHVWPPQSEKRAGRAELLEGRWQGAVRPRHLRPLPSDGLPRLGRSDPAEVDLVVRHALETCGIGFPASDPRATEYLVFAGHDEMAALIETMHEAKHWDALLSAAPVRAPAKPKKVRRQDPALREVRDVFDEALAQGSQSVEIAVAGRMVADRTDLNVVSATYTSFGISTHRSTAEVDWFAAVDDLARDDGAGMLGYQEIVAPTMYTCAVVDARQLTRNLHGDLGLAGQALRAWLWSVARTMPTGKEHAMFARAMPSALLACLRQQLKH